MPTHIILGAAVAAAALAMITTAIALVVTKKKPGQAPPAMAFFPLAVALLGVVFILAVSLNMKQSCQPPEEPAAGLAQPASPQPSIVLPDRRPPKQVCVKRDVSEEDKGRHIITKDICITGYEKIDELVAAEIEKQEEQFLVDIEAPELMPLSNKFALRLSTDESIFGRVPEVQSIRLIFDQAIGGAQPSQEFSTWTFDRITDRIIDFDLMFLPGSNPQKTILTYARQQLGNVDFMKGENWSFDNFMVQGNDLMLYFEPCTVAPCAAGTQTVTIPLAEIQSILRPPFLSLADTEIAEPPPPEPDYATPCDKEGGNWLAEYDECEYVGRDWCEQQNGQFLECESACRHDPDAEFCTLQCVPVCQL